MHTEVSGVTGNLDQTADGEVIIPLTESQRGFWAQAALGLGAECAFNVARTVELTGPYNHLAMRRALQALVNRHEALRVRLSADCESQVITPRATVEAPLIDVGALTAPERKVEALLALEASAAQPFAPACAPWLRALTVKLAEDRHLLALTAHHAVINGPSYRILLEELCTLYQGRIDLAARMQLSDFVRCQPTLARAEDEAFWLQQFAEAPPCLELPFDRPRPRWRSFKGGHASRRFDAAVCQSLRNIAAARGGSLYALLLGAFNVLLGRLSAQEDVVVGATFESGVRELPGGAGLVANTTNVLPLRSCVPCEATFSQQLKQTHRVIQAAAKHKEYFFGRLIERLNVPHDPSRHPLFSVLFNFYGGEFCQKAGDLEVKLLRGEFPYSAPRGTAMFDLALDVTKNSGGLEFRCDYAADLFEPGTIRRWLDCYRRLLEGIAANPEARLADLPLLDEAERHQILVDWNATARAYPTGRCLHQLIEAQVERTPGAIALVYEGQELTYEQLNRRANRLAHSLREGGVGPDVIVGVLAQPSLDMIIGILAILKAGGAYLPLDPDHPAHRLALMLDDARPAVILAQHRWAGILAARAETVMWLEEGGGTEEANPVNGTRPDNLAYVIYTSGSTGIPKGTMNTHAGICNFLLWLQEAFELGSEDRILQKTAFTFDVSLAEIFGALTAGARLVLVPPKFHGDTRHLVDAVVEHGITAMWFVTSVLEAFLHEARIGRCVSLRHVTTGGEPLSFELKGHFFTVLPRARLHNFYGPTETVVAVTAWECRPDGDERTVPIGRPVANTKVYLLDRALQPVPVGVAGELHIGGAQVARGYLNRPELTAERFIANPFGPGQLYKTGDRCRYGSDGVLEYLGRLDQQVKVRGFRIELGEIEAALKKVPGVRDCVAMAREDGPGGAAHKRLVAYLLGEALTAEALRRQAQASLPDYMVPSAFVFLDRWPLTPNGKLDRHALPAPEQTGEGFVEPRTALERQVADAWKAVLGLEQVGLNDSFFELGGDSLTAVRLVNRLAEGVTTERVPVALVFQAPTLARFAEVLETEAYAASEPPPRRIPRLARPQAGPDGAWAAPASFGQRRLWLSEQVNPGQPTYNIPSALRLRGALNVTALERALAEVVRRHESLRTSFRRGPGGEPLQVINPAFAIDLAVEDLRALGPHERPARTRELLEAESWRPFDLAQGPLWRAKLLRTAGQEHVLALTFHHIIYDEWSERVFRNELLAAYAALATGAEPHLPEMLIQYADYAQWQRERLAGKRLEELLSFWRERLAGLPVLELPTDRPHGRRQTFAGANEPVAVPRAVAAALKALGQAERASLFMTLLTGFKVLLVRYSNQEDLAVGSPVTERGSAEAEGLIGFFLNTLVLRTTVERTLSFREALGRVRDTTLAAFRHQELPFEVLVEALAPSREAGQNPLFQAAFVMMPDRGPVTASLAGLTWEPIDLEDRTAKFDLILELVEGPEGLKGHFNYNAELFEAATVRRLADHFCTLLEGIVAGPDAPISELPLLGEAERRQVLVDWNATDRAYPTNLCLHQLIEAQVERTPEAIALVYEGQTLTYHQLDQAATALAGRLQALGARPDVPVGLLSERSVELVIGMLAALKAGSAYLPMDPAHPVDRLRFILEDAKPAALLVQDEFRTRLPSGLDTPIVSLQERLPATERLGPAEFGPESLAYVIYTSGSTGEPKGVMIPHGAVCNFLHWIQETYGLLPAERVLQKSAYTFDFSIPEFFWPLITGAAVVLAKAGAHADSDYLVEVINTQRVSTIDFVPAALAHFLDNPNAASCLSLRRVFCGGEALPPELVARFFAVLPHAQLYNGYGPTETTVFATTWPCQPEASAAPSVPIGRPLANTQIYLLDPSMQPVPVGVVGEVYIGGRQLAQGYLGRPELTAERFVHNPFGPGRLYKSGDLAHYRPDGAIVYVGRADFQVKLRGLRIELGEIETVLKQVPGVRDCVTSVRQVHGPADKRLVAYVTGQGLREEQLRAHAQGFLPSYMVPSAFVTLDRLPLNANGKLDRHALPPPDFGRRQRERVEPRNVLEAQLLNIWCDVLGQTELGVTDDFFELGGHSLLALALFTRIEQRLNCKLPLAMLFRAPTVEKQAAALAGDSPNVGWGPVVPIQLRGERPAFFAIHGAGGNVLFYRQLARLLGSDQPFYALQSEGLDGGPITRTSVEAMAGYYLEQVRRIQPRGPYLLGGYSFGGLVAYEMARRLHQTGAEVPLLVIFDSRNPALSRSTFRVDLQNGLRNPVTLVNPNRVFRFLAHRAGGTSTRRVLRWNEALHRRLKWRFLGWRMLGRARASVGPVIAHIETVHELAAVAYRPLPYAGKVVLFRSTAEEGAGTDGGWGQLAQGGVDIHTITGTHLELFSSENAPSIAERLRACIQTALLGQDQAACAAPCHRRSETPVTSPV